MTDPEPSSGIVVGALEGWREFYKWRLSLRGTMVGRIGVFVVQFVLGVVLVQLARVMFGAPNNLVSYALTVAGGVGVGLAGPLSFSLASMVFWLVIGTVMGLALGIWPYLPSWWRDIHAQWISGATIPNTVIGAGILFMIVWALSGIGIGKLRDNKMPVLLGHIILKLRPAAHPDRKNDALRKALPSDEEAARLIQTAFDDSEGSVIRPMPRMTTVSQESAPERPLTREDLTGDFILNTTNDSDELAGLAPLESIRASADLSKSDTSSTVPVSEPAPPETTAGPASGMDSLASASPSMRGQGMFRINSLLNAFEIAMSSPDQRDALDQFLRERSSLISKLSLSDMDSLRETENGEALHSLISGYRASLPGFSVVTEPASAMFSEIPATVQADQPVAAAIAAAVPFPVPTEPMDDKAEYRENSPANPDASSDSPVASGRKASGGALAKAMARKTAQAMARDAGVPLDEPVQVPASKSRDAFAAFGIPLPSVMGEERDALLKQALAGESVDPSGVQPAGDDTQSSVPLVDIDTSRDGDLSGQLADDAGEPDDVSALEFIVDADDVVPAVAADQAIIDDVEPESAGEDEAAEDDFVDSVEIIDSNGLLRLVSGDRVAAVTSAPRKPSPFAHLPEKPTDDDWFNLGLLPPVKVVS